MPDSYSGQNGMTERTGSISAIVAGGAAEIFSGLYGHHRYTALGQPNGSQSQKEDYASNWPANACQHGIDSAAVLVSIIGVYYILKGTKTLLRGLP